MMGTGQLMGDGFLNAHFMPTKKAQIRRSRFSCPVPVCESQGSQIPKDLDLMIFWISNILILVNVQTVELINFPVFFYLVDSNLKFPQINSVNQERQTLCSSVA